MVTATVWGREPVVIIGTVNAVVQLAVGFGFDISGERQALIATAVTAVLALFTRQTVTPTEQVALTKDDMEAIQREHYLP